MPPCNEKHPTIKRNGTKVLCALEKGHDGAHTTEAYNHTGEVVLERDKNGDPTKTKRHVEEAVDQWVDGAAA